MRDRPIAVVGATGFIGSRVVSDLRDAGHPVAGFSSAHPPVVDGTPARGLRDAEVVFFLAARMSPALASRRPDRVAGERALLHEVLEAVRLGGRKPVFVLASSGTVYAPHERGPYPETAPAGPTTAYGRAKRRLEEDLHDHRDAVHPVALRIGNVYGPGQPAAEGYGVLPIWLAAASRREPVRMIGDPLTVRDYVHVDDAAELLGRIGDATAELPTVLNVGSGTPTTLLRLLDIVCDVVGRDLEVLREEGRAADRQLTYLDPTLAFSTLGWRARTSLIAGVRQCWEWRCSDRAAIETISR